MYLQHVANVAGIVLAALAARVLFLLLIPSTAVSVDMHSWERVVEHLDRGANPYVSTRWLNWPPFWMQVLYLLNAASRFFHVPLFRAVQILLIMAEAGLTAILYLAILSLGTAPSHARRWLMWGISLNPVAIFQVCQHLNFDVILAVWIALAMSMLLQFGRTADQDYWLLGGLFLGLGILTKTVPVLLLPLLLAGVRSVNWRRRLLCAALVLGPVGLGLSILYVLAPHDIRLKVLGYRSACAGWGITGCLNLIAGETAWRAYTIGFARIAPLALATAAVWAYRQPPEQRILVFLANTLLLLLPVVGTGFATQYLYWYVPSFLLAYATGNRTIRVAVGVVYAVAVATCVLVYGLLPSHGAFMLQLLPDRAELIKLSDILGSATVQPLLFLPLYAAFAALFMTVLLALRAAARRSCVGTP
mgnify:CR=1 FL=1